MLHLLPEFSKYKKGEELHDSFFWSDSMCPHLKQSVKKNEERIWISFKPKNEPMYFKLTLKNNESNIENYFNSKKL